MTLNQWLQRLETLHFKSIDLGLDRIQQVAERLHLFTDLPFIITVGGTNGKGSTIALLNSILLQSGHRVGMYTSPHLVHFNERITVDGQHASDQNIVRALEVVEQARGDISLTYFEFTTLAAIWLFKEAKLDVWLLEVGLGGRLDAVNLWDADLAVITSIDLDHQQWLGPDRATIGLEKLGIARSGKPLIMGEREVPSALQEHMVRNAIPVWQIDQAFENPLTDAYSESSEADTWWARATSHQGQIVEWAGLPQPAMHPDNAAVALQTLLLSPFCPTQEHIKAGILRMTLTGRQQVIRTDPEVMLDVGHNPHAARWLRHRLAALKSVDSKSGQIHCVVGMLSDKAVLETLAELLGVVDIWYPVSLPGPRGMRADELGTLLQDSGVVIARLGETASQVVDRLVLTLKQQGRLQDRIVVFGSFFTVADLLQ